MKTFVSEKYGQTKKLFVGQKVECTYYHEYLNNKDAYQRSFISKLIDKPFKPVKLGVILGDAGIHPYWLGVEGKEQYLFVKFKEYRFAKPIPISCIQDALEAAEKIKTMLNDNMDKIGEPGFSLESFKSLSTNMLNAYEFTNQK